MLIRVVAAWYVMLATHELGHGLHALLSGVTVLNINFPLIGFPYTQVGTPTRSLFLLWGGFIWGCGIPMSAYFAVCAMKNRTVLWLRREVGFLAGFCLLANGAYLAAGAVYQIGDAAEMIRAGSPLGLLVTIGIVLAAFGLLFWHRLKLQFLPRVRA